MKPYIFLFIAAAVLVFCATMHMDRNETYQSDPFDSQFNYEQQAEADLQSYGTGQKYELDDTDYVDVNMFVNEGDFAPTVSDVESGSDEADFASEIAIAQWAARSRGVY